MLNGSLQQQVDEKPDGKPANQVHLENIGRLTGSSEVFYTSFNLAQVFDEPNAFPVTQPTVSKH